MLRFLVPVGNKMINIDTQEIIERRVNICRQVTDKLRLETGGFGHVGCLRACDEAILALSCSSVGVGDRFGDGDSVK